MATDLRARLRAFVADPAATPTDERVALEADLELAIAIADAVLPHLAAVRASHIPGSPPGGVSINDPPYRATGEALVKALSPIAHRLAPPSAPAPAPGRRR